MPFSPAPERVDLALVQEAEPVEQRGLVDDAVVAHHLDRQDVGVRAGLVDQAGDEGAVAEERVDQALQRVDQVRLVLAAADVVGHHAAVAALVAPAPDHRLRLAEPEPRVVGYPGVQDRHHRPPGRAAALRWPAQPVHRHPAAPARGRVLTRSGTVAEAEPVPEAETVAEAEPLAARLGGEHQVVQPDLDGRRIVLAQHLDRPPGVRRRTRLDGRRLDAQPEHSRGGGAGPVARLAHVLWSGDQLDAPRPGGTGASPGSG